MAAFVSVFLTPGVRGLGSIGPGIKETAEVSFLSLPLPWGREAEGLTGWSCDSCGQGADQRDCEG